MKKQTGRFTATDNDGRQFAIYIFTDFIDAGDRVNPNKVIEGLKELRTSDGMVINRLQKGEYQIVQTGVILRSNSPDAL